MTDLASEFQTPLVPAHPLVMRALKMGRSAAYDLLGAFDAEFKRQRGVGLPRAGKSNALLIDRERFELLRLVRRDYEDGTFVAYRDALRFHLNPSSAFVVDLDSLSAQIRDVHGELNTLRDGQIALNEMAEELLKWVKENQTLLVALRSSVAELEARGRSSQVGPVNVGRQPLTLEDEPEAAWDFETVLSP
jgi:hypothetical protein